MMPIMFKLGPWTQELKGLVRGPRRAALGGALGGEQACLLPPGAVIWRFGLTLALALVTLAVLSAFAWVHPAAAAVLGLTLLALWPALAWRAMQVPVLWVGPAGLRGRPPGRAMGWTQLPWSDSVTLSAQAQGLLPGVVVRAGLSGQAVFVPTALLACTDFLQAIDRFAPRSHPLRQLCASTPVCTAG